VSIRAPSPATAPVGNSPMIAPTRLAATATFSDVKRYGSAAGQRSFQKVCAPLAFQVRIWSSSMVSGLRNPFTMPTTTGKNERYIEISALGRSPAIPIEESTTMIIGAMARIGTVWLAITQGITLALVVRSCTIPTASRIPSAAPSTKPASVADSVTQA